MEKQSRNKLDAAIHKFKDNPMISKAVKEKLNKKSVLK